MFGTLNPTFGYNNQKVSLPSEVNVELDTFYPIELEIEQASHCLRELSVWYLSL